MQGINNLGSTCAINSLIQILYRNEKLKTAIMKAPIVDETKTSITKELREIFEIMDNNENQSIQPYKFINTFYEIFEGIFNKYEQIDINELWMFLYEKINEETSVETKEIKKETITNINEEHDMKINIYNNKKESELLKKVQGSFINIIQCCNCEHKSYSFEPFINISVDIIDMDNAEPHEKTLVNLIINHLKVETREDDWKCDNCKNKCKYLKTIKLWKLPEILFITLNRFKDINRKNTDEIIINDIINFNKGSVVSMNEDKPYLLSSLGLHNGSLMGGHYTSLCKNKQEPDKYYLYNDEYIRVIKKEDLGIINMNSVYMVVYELAVSPLIIELGS